MHNQVRMFTFLRDPVRRFISEWKHMQRGAYWNFTKNHCNPENRYKECFEPGFDVSLMT